MADSLFTLGGIVFHPGEIHADGYNRTTEYRHNFVDAIRGEGARTYTGKGADSIVITGAVFPGQYGQADAVDALRAAARPGQPMQFMDGNGFLIGRYVIQSIDEERTAILPGGAGRRVTYTVNLRKDPTPLNV